MTKDSFFPKMVYFMVRGEYSIKVKPSHSPKTYLLHLLFLHQQYPQKDNIYSVVHPICQASCLIYAATRRWTGKFLDEDDLAHFQYPEKICIPTPSPCSLIFPRHHYSSPSLLQESYNSIESGAPPRSSQHTSCHRDALTV